MTPSWKLLVRGLFVAAVLAAGLALNSRAPDRAESPTAHADPIATAPAGDPADPAGDEVFPGAPRITPKFTGYCKCSCSRVKNCNTSADCGGGACIAGITCCAAPDR